MTVPATRPVVGLADDQSLMRAPCCQPVPGERIVGITHRGKGVVAHAMDCPALADFQDAPDRWVDLRWHAGQHAPVHTVTLEVTIANASGVLGRICSVVGDLRTNISDLHFLDKKPDYYRLSIDVDLRDVEQLHTILTALDAETDVASVARLRDPARKP